MLKSLLPIALLAVAIPFAPVHAKADGAVRVGYADLNLANEKGVERLDRRLTKAIDALCADVVARPAESMYRAVKRCRTDKLTQIAPQRDAAIANARQGTALAASAY